MGHQINMAKNSIPEVLSTSPVSLTCPYCGAKRGEDCETLRGEVALVHVARIEAAANADTRKRNKQERVAS